MYVLVPLELRQPFSTLPKQHHLPRNSYEELSNVSNTITSLKQNDLLNVILYGDKNFDSKNNQSMMETKI